MKESIDGDELAARLGALRVDPPDAGFSSSLHLKLSSAGPPDAPSFWRRLLARPRAPLAAYALAAAMACALVAILSFEALTARIPAPGEMRGIAPIAQTSRAQAQAPLAVSELPATQVAMVRFNLSANVAVQSARLRVALPEGLVFWSDGKELAQRSFEWAQPLRAGDNEIPVAVRGLKPGRYRMTVTATMGGERIEDEVLLEVVDG